MIPIRCFSSIRCNLISRQAIQYSLRYAPVHAPSAIPGKRHRHRGGATFPVSQPSWLPCPRAAAVSAACSRIAAILAATSLSRHPGKTIYLNRIIWTKTLIHFRLLQSKNYPARIHALAHFASFLLYSPPAALEDTEGSDLQSLNHAKTPRRKRG